MAYSINRNDIIRRIYFIIRLVQNHKGSTMQGALTSKSDSMGGIFDRFINTISDTLVFNKIIFKAPELSKYNIEAIEDFYYYNPSKSVAGIAPDILGITFNGNKIKFAEFDNEWKSIEGMPQIEVKTFKKKDQMISLRNQNYEGKYLVLVDLDLRIDYLVPFFDKQILSKSLVNSMKMDDSIFIVNDEKKLIDKVEEVDFSNDNDFGDISLISVTDVEDFTKSATLCDAGTSVSRMKELTKRKVKIKKNKLNDDFSLYAKKSQRLDALYEFNEKWYKKFGIDISKNKYVDFSCRNIDHIKICKYNTNGIVISPDDKDCQFNGIDLKKDEQYTITFETLDRSGSTSGEYFMQKECASYLKGCQQHLVDIISNIIDGYESNTK